MSQSKRFGLSETGTGNEGAVTQGGGPVDEGDYPLYLAERLSAAAAQGLQIEFVDVWAQPTGTDRLDFLSGSRPLEAKAWREFGVIMAGMTARQNVAIGKVVTASTSYNTTLAPANTTDGKSTTRWSSKDGSGTQWIRVDLGQRYTLSRVRLQWDAGYASTYKLQISNDGSNWTDIHSTATGDGATDEVVGLNALGRYVRLLCTGRGAGWTYSLREMEVYP